MAKRERLKRVNCQVCASCVLLPLRRRRRGDDDDMANNLFFKKNEASNLFSLSPVTQTKLVLRFVPATTHWSTAKKKCPVNARESSEWLVLLRIAKALVRKSCNYASACAIFQRTSQYYRATQFCPGWHMHGQIFLSNWGEITHPYV